MPVMSNREIRKAMTKMRVRSNDVILIKSGSALAEMENIERFDEVLESIGVSDILIFVVDDFNDITVLDEATMAKHGWYKRDKITSLLVRNPQKLEHTKPEVEEA